MSSRSYLVLSAVCLATTLAVRSVQAAGSPEGPPAVEVSHWQQRGPVGTSVSVAPGTFFEVKVVESCRLFKLASQAVTPPKAEKSGALKSATARPLALADYGVDCLVEPLPPLLVPHQAGNAGYIVELRAASEHAVALRPEAPGPRSENEVLASLREETLALCSAAAPGGGCETDDALRAILDEPTREKVLRKIGATKKLSGLTIAVTVESPSPFRLELSGGFTSSFLTDRVYGLRVQDAGATPTTYRVYEDPAARDTARLGVAAMIHVSDKRLLRGSLAGTFGLGVSDGSQVDYFFGLSLRAVGQFFVTAGLHLGQVARLPNGVTVDSVVTDPNVLSNLPKRTSGAFFFGVSYAFLNPGQAAFSKAFKPVKSAEASE